MRCEKTKLFLAEPKGNFTLRNLIDIQDYFNILVIRHILSKEKLNNYARLNQESGYAPRHFIEYPMSGCVPDYPI